MSIPYQDRIPNDGPLPARDTTQPLSEEFGRRLDTIEKARQWLTNPHNWHKTRLFILKWDGLIPTVTEEHGRRLFREWWDDGLPWCVVQEQQKRKTKHARGESLEEPEAKESEE